MEEREPIGTATYSPDDNKLRLYPFARLDAETYARVKERGFKWAPKQELFVAPMWTPQREDLLIELCGDIGDEDTSLVDRAEERADRFEDYSGKRLQDAERARASVAAIADNIPLGQPILVGHHSERRARKDAERIEAGMSKAVKLWETSKYWQDRAAGALAHARYKELPRVRANRIKTIEADRRRELRNQKAAADRLALFWKVFDDSAWKTREDGNKPPMRDRVLQLFALGGWALVELPDKVKRGEVEPEEAALRVIRGCRSQWAWAQRWIDHFDHRLEYERAMLQESGYTPPPKPKTRAALPLLNYPGIVRYASYGNIGEAEAHPMTKAEYAKIHTDYKGTWNSADGSHRVRVALIRKPGAGHSSYGPVFLTDSKQHTPPATPAEPPQEPPTPALVEDDAPPRVHIPASRERSVFDDMKDTLRNGGVQVVSALQLFPTPPELAARVVEAADIEPGRCTILEPSAGLGNLLDAVPDLDERIAVGNVVAVEVNAQLAQCLRDRLGCNVHAADFLTLNGGLGKFDRVIMNPPFENGADIKHIRHALSFLLPGGRLVAICANGPRQREALKSLAEESGGYWEDLPAGSFATAGTNVNTALVVIEGS